MKNHAQTPGALLRLLARKKGISAERLAGWGLRELGGLVRLLVAPRVSLHGENHRFTRTDIPMKHPGVERAGITIEDDRWNGAGSLIVPRVRIGSGSMVAAGAVVTKDVPAFSIVGGVPAKVIGDRRSQEDQG